MKRKDISIFISSAGPNVSRENIRDTIVSISSNVGNKNIGFFFATDNQEILDYCSALILPEQLLGSHCNGNSWASNFNSFFERFKDESEYIMISHDDLAIRTYDFLEKTMSQISNMEDQVGWITFTSDGYYRQKSIPMANSVREGFAVDRNRYPYLFECHQYNNGDVFTDANAVLLDYPTRAVKVHAIFPHIMLIKSENLSKIGMCEDWTPYTLLIDEDWGMEALRKGFWNVWIPDVFYTHPLRYEARRQEGVRYEQQAHAAFAKKWGFYFGSGTYTDDFIRHICEKYAGTNIPLSAGKNTFEWQYLKP